MTESECIEQLCKDLNQAHDEILKVQDVPFELRSLHDWPSWSPQAHTIRAAEKLLGKRLAKTDLWTLYPSGNEPGE